MKTAKDTQKLPRKGRSAVKRWSQNIPLPLWERMRESGLGWGEVTQFINQAIKEKLDRMDGEDNKKP